jgi:hypothetical protein
MKMVFDVEANGLHGEGFAVGWVLQCCEGEIISEGFSSASVFMGENVDPWVAENVLPHLPAPTHETCEQVRSVFWAAWLAAKAQGATLWADCGWPVEANFLSACVADDKNRAWEGPYPLHEIATVFEMAQMGATEKHERLDGETEHHPTGDARQSARLLFKALKRVNA